MKGQVRISSTIEGWREHTILAALVRDIDVQTKFVRNPQLLPPGVSASEVQEFLMVMLGQFIELSVLEPDFLGYTEQAIAECGTPA